MTGKHSRNVKRFGMLIALISCLFLADLGLVALADQPAGNPAGQPSQNQNNPRSQANNANPASNPTGSPSPIQKTMKGLQNLNFKFSWTGTPAKGKSTGQTEEANAGTAFDVRKNYFKRFPYAKAAFDSDLLLPVQGSMPGGKGASRLRRSAGKFGDSWEKPMFPVVAYQKVIKFCNDDPTKGICYQQPILIAIDQPATFRDLELFKNTLNTTGLPMSDTQFQLIDRENKQRFLELLFDPERFLWLATNTGQLAGAAAANSFGGTAETTFDACFDRIVQADTSGIGMSGAASGGGGGVAGGSLINVANEQASRPTATDNLKRTSSQAIWMVQKMYHFVFMPMAILLLLPGAVLTHTKGIVSQGFRLGHEDSTSPFEGILRAIIAIFLIPATQLIVSYCIDIGNSLALSVQPWISRDAIFNWAHEQSYNVPVGNAANVVEAPGLSSTVSGAQTAVGKANSQTLASGKRPSNLFNLNIFGDSQIGNMANGVLNNVLNSTIGNVVTGITDFFSTVTGTGGQGKAANQSETSVIPEQQLWLSQTLQLAFNVVEYMVSYAIIVVTAYQLVMMCYLFLLGPVAAAFFAWPTGIGQSLFRQVFSSWLNGVISLSLWRFYWCVILAIMAQRLVYLGGRLNVNSEYEMMVFTCFLGLLLYAPFAPFSFDPGSAATRVLSMGGSVVSQGTQQFMQGAQAGGMPQGQLQALQQQLAPLESAGKYAQALGQGMQDDALRSQGVQLNAADKQPGLQPAPGNQVQPSPNTQPGSQPGIQPGGQSGTPGVGTNADLGIQPPPTSSTGTSTPGASPGAAAPPASSSAAAPPMSGSATESPAATAVQPQLPAGTSISLTEPGGPAAPNLTPQAGTSQQTPNMMINTNNPQLANAALPQTLNTMAALGAVSGGTTGGPGGPGGPGGTVGTAPAGTPIGPDMPPNSPPPTSPPGGPPPTGPPPQSTA